MVVAYVIAGLCKALDGDGEVYAVTVAARSATEYIDIILLAWDYLYIYIGVMHDSRKDAIRS